MTAVELEHHAIHLRQRRCHNANGVEHRLCIAVEEGERGGGRAVEAAADAAIPERAVVEGEGRVQVGRPRERPFRPERGVRLHVVDAHVQVPVPAGRLELAKVLVAEGCHREAIRLPRRVREARVGVAAALDGRREAEEHRRRRDPHTVAVEGDIIGRHPAAEQVDEREAVEEWHPLRAAGPVAREHVAVAEAIVVVRPSLAVTVVVGNPGQDEGAQRRVVEHLLVHLGHGPVDDDGSARAGIEELAETDRPRHLTVVVTEQGVWPGGEG